MADIEKNKDKTGPSAELKIAKVPNGAEDDGQNEMLEIEMTTDLWKEWQAVVAIIAELVVHIALLVLTFLVMIDLYNFCWCENERKLVLDNFYYYGSKAYFWTLLGSFFDIHLLAMNLCSWGYLLYGVMKSDEITLKSWSILRKVCALLMLLPALAIAVGGHNEFSTANTVIFVIYLAYSLIVVSVMEKIV